MAPRLTVKCDFVHSEIDARADLRMDKVELRPELLMQVLPSNWRNDLRCSKLCKSSGNRIPQCFYHGAYLDLSQLRIDRERNALAAKIFGNFEGALFVP